MMRISKTVLVVLAASLLSTGCSGGESSPTDDAGDDAAQDCHIDCFADLACDRGDKVGECQEGCQDAVEVTAGANGQNWEQLCEENRPRAVGELCTSNEDCAPPESYYDPDAEELQDKTLTCDQERGVCIDPEVPEFLADCDASLADVDVGEGYVLADGDTAIPGCSSSDYCYIEKSRTETCQLCTIECEEHADCPSGSGCHFAQNLDAPGESPIQICQPLQWDTVQGVVQCDANP